MTVIIKLINLWPSSEIYLGASKNNLSGMVQYCTSCECVATLVVQLNVFHNPLAKLCSFLKVNTYLNCSFCVLICTFLSTIC